jgi:hypothetical protein
VKTSEIDALGQKSFRIFDTTVSVLGGNHYENATYAKQLSDVSYVAAGFFVGGAVTKDGTLIIWGRNVEDFTNDKIEKLILYKGSNSY